ncbi:hypothetical protein P8452_66678 [Trifolium repens]|nr:hypothetical protein P8452_66678 [Trifolium repens]
MAVGTQTAIIGAAEHLKCKLLSGTLKEAALRWYINLPKNSIENWLDFQRKFIQQFSGSKHIKVTATSLFTTRQNYAETLLEYLARFCEATIKVSNPNQEMFVAAFHNGLKAGHFHESLAQKPATSMQEIIKRAECYIKGEERLTRLPPQRGRELQLGQNMNALCAYHRCKGHDTEKCFRLRDLIEELIKSGHLRKFRDDAANRKIVVPKARRDPQRDQEENPEGEKVRISVNTIAGGFAGGGELSNARKCYVRRAEFEAKFVGHTSISSTPDLSFTKEDKRKVMAHDDDPLVIQVQILNCDVKRVLIDSGSSADIMYWEAFKAVQLSNEHLLPYNGTLVGFAGEQVEVMGCTTLLTTFGEKDQAKTIKVRYLVVKTPFTSYNIIIGRPSFNTLEAAMSTLYLSIKYPLEDGRVGTIKGDQTLARRCYESNLDPREEFQDRRVSLIEELEKVQIGEATHQTTNIDTSLQPEEREKILVTLKRNIDLFTWQPSDMPGIDETIITHKLSISPETKPISQKKRKVGEERRAAIIEEVTKLKEAEFIEEIKYPSWLANVLMVKKANGKWRMCVDFTDLNKACPKDPYPLPNIDRLIDEASGYNQIKMNPADAPHTAFMTNTCNYFYNVMPFGLKNAGATYQRLTDMVFSEQIGKNLEVYIDDMVVKTTEAGEHDQDLSDILASVRKYYMRLNPSKCSFGVQLFKIAALSRFLSCAGEKAFHFFSTLQKSERFVWSTQCEEAFQNLKTFLASSPILTRPEKGNTMYLYLVVSDKALSSALVKEIKGEEKHIYFFSRTFKRVEAKYQKIEKPSLAVIVTARKLRQYFQSHKIVVKTDYPIENVLRKPDLAGRMVAWSVELS